MAELPHANSRFSLFLLLHLTVQIGPLSNSNVTQRVFSKTLGWFSTEALL